MSPKHKLIFNVIRRLIFIHRRRWAERDGGFQRRLFVCLFVSLFVNTITSERLNTVWWNLAVRCIVQKSRSSSSVKIKGQRSGSPGTKNQKVRHFVRESSFGAWSSASSIRRWENQRMLSSYSSPQCSHCKRCTSYGNSVCLCLSVRPSVTRRYCVKTTARSTVQFALSDSIMCLVL